MNEVEIVKFIAEVGTPSIICVILLLKVDKSIIKITDEMAKLNHYLSYYINNIIITSQTSQK